MKMRSGFMRRSNCAVFCAAWAAFGTADLANAQIVVMQVEAGISAVQPAYAPVEFVSGGVVHPTTTDVRYGAIVFSNTYGGLTSSSASFSSFA